MIDRLLAWWNRPLEDPERRRLFAFAALGLVALAAVLVAQRGAVPEARPPGPAPPPTEGQPRVRAAEPAEQSADGDQTPEPGEERGSGGEDRYQPTSSEVADAKRAARRFLRGYLPYTYGRGGAARIRSVDPDLRASLAREPPRVPSSVARKARPRVTTVQAESIGRGRASALALVADGRRRYTVTLGLEREEGEWRVADIAS